MRPRTHHSTQQKRPSRFPIPLLDWIATQPDLDAKRIVVIGGSYGGYMTLTSMTHFNDRLRGAIDIVGISNFVSCLESTAEYRRDLRQPEYGGEVWCLGLNEGHGFAKRDNIDYYQWAVAMFLEKLK